MNIMPQEKAVRTTPASANFVLVPIRPPSSLDDSGAWGAEMRRGRGACSTGGGVGVTPGGRVRITIGAGVRITTAAGVRVTTAAGVVTTNAERAAPGGGVTAIRAAGVVPAGGGT